MHPRLLAATLHHRSHTDRGLHFSGGAISLALFPKRHQKARGSSRPGSRQRIEESEIAMVLSPLSNSLIEALNRFQGGSQLLNERLRHESMGDEDPLVSRQGPGPFDGLKPLVDALLTPQVMLTQELLQRATPGELGRFARRPLSQKGAKQPRLLIGEPLENLRKIMLQNIGQSIRDPNAVRHPRPTMFNQLA